MSSLFSAVAVVWIESAAAWASAGALAGVQGGGLALASQVPGPPSAEAEAVRASARTALLTDT